MTNYARSSTHHVLSLRDIAAWQLTGIKGISSSNILAKVPSLQRGLVWEPQQIEMLWDSLMRGFPVGALVLSQPIKEQQTKTNSIGKDATTEPTHHILDGQQRSYAITLGFNDPWSNGDDDQAILWLDIEPGARLKNSVRKYLFRVTTKAHPWGFHHGDESVRLPFSEIKEFLNKFTKTEEDARPLPEKSIPQDAGLPVPMFLLLEHFKDDKLDWDAVASNRQLEGLIDNFSNRVRAVAAKPESADIIESGLRLAEQAVIVALQVPPGAMGIENIEQIFQRLNRQGTPLDAEELVYSMIKAYWPEVEQALANVPQQTTESRLIGMAVRVALMDTDEQGKVMLPAELSVSAIRNIFRPGQKDAKEVDRRDRIEKFVLQSGELGKALRWIDEHLLYDVNTRTYGLPAFLRSSLAWNSREVFTWLIALAKQVNYQSLNDNLTRKIIGLTLAIHWFGVDKGKAIDYLLKQDVRSDPIRLSDIKDKQAFVLPLLDIAEFRDAIPLHDKSGEASLKAWTSMWDCVVAFDEHGVKRSEQDTLSRKEKYFQFLDHLHRNRELLVYVQRSYFDAKFRDFDPSNKLMWKGHNRPWDYDHILPSNKLDGRGSRSALDFQKVCKVWQQSIGNLVAVDFSFNRRAQDRVAASAKYGSASKLCGRFGKRLADYDIELSDTQGLVKSRNFVVAAKERMVDLYCDWYQTLEVASYK